MTLIVFAIFLIFIHIIANFTLAEGGSKNQTVMAANFIPLTLEFGYSKAFNIKRLSLLITLSISSGGMELLFQNRKSIKINVPVPEGGLRIRELLSFIRDEVKPDRPELFMQEDTM